MSSIQLDSFLSEARSSLLSDECTDPLTIVMGNDSADLDSIISAVLFAFLSARESHFTKIFVPLVKVPRADLSLRPEVSYVFETAGVDPQLLIWMDEVDVDKLERRNPSVTLMLVDHNRLTPPFQQSWASRVVGVLDHHVDEGYYLDAPLRVIDMVGSCVSLVVLHFAHVFEDCNHDTSAISTLALAPIEIDTIHLRLELGKTTQSDVKAHRIIAPLSCLEKTPLFIEHAEAAKSRVDHLSVRDLLRKDYKEWVVAGFRIGTSSLQWNFRAWAARDGPHIVPWTLDFCKERELDMQVILTSYDHEDQGGYQRELAFFIPCQRLHFVRTALEAMPDLQLSRLDMIPNDQTLPSNVSVVFYHQGNNRLSRKQIWPRLQEIIERTS